MRSPATYPSGLVSSGIEGIALASSTSDPKGIMTKNPFRYRGYVYDNETQLYYLRSRYYDPSLGRFISSDSLMSTGQGVLGLNMYAYCLNNPVNMSDSSGCAGFWDSLSNALAVVAVVALVVAIVAVAVVVTVGTAGIGGAALAAVGGGIIASGGAIAATATAVAATAVVVTVTAAAGAVTAMSVSKYGSDFGDKQHKGTPGNNQAQNQQFNDVVNKLKLTKNQAQILHRAIRHLNYGYWEILEEALALFGK